MLQDRDLLKLVTSVLLLCCLAFGYLRGEHLREQPASMIIHLAGATQTPVRVTVIMSFDQGVLVFEPPNRGAAVLSLESHLVDGIGADARRHQPTLAGLARRGARLDP